MKDSVIYFECLGYTSESMEEMRRYFCVKSFMTPDSSEYLEYKDSAIKAIFCPLGYRFGKIECERFPNVRVFASNTTSIPHIDEMFCKENGVQICALHNKQEFLDRITPTAELAIGLMISVARQIGCASEDVRKGTWNRRKWGSPFMLSRRTLGVVGYGRLGRKVIKAAEGLGMKTCWYDPYLEDDGDERRRATIKGLASESDIVSLHCSLNRHNVGMINASVFKYMKDGSILINTARGDLVNNRDLIEALESGKLYGAGLDTIDGEFRTGFADNALSHELVRYAQVNRSLLLTPHIGGSTLDAWSETEMCVINESFEYLGGQG